MIVSLKQGADAAAVLRELTARGLWVSQVEKAAEGATHYVIASHSAAADVDELARIEGISAVTAPASAHPLVDRMGGAVDVDGVRVGKGGEPALFLGPCSVESRESLRVMAERLAARGVRFLRGGAFKPRTSPYAFQGHGVDALAWMREAADATGMKVVTEALSEHDLSAVAEHADMIQVGSRNMQNFALLKAVGRTKRPVLLKRAMAGTIEEWLSAGEYLLANGCPGVVFCERGVRGFDTSTRNVLDLGAVALFAHVLGLPVVVDPSHGAGRRDLVMPLARAAFAAGAAGVMIETHEDPGRALSDGPQAIPLDELLGALGSLSGQHHGGAS
jgi:3-deoxy-7-phosphoheptulonate synthase